MFVGTWIVAKDFALRSFITEAEIRNTNLHAYLRNEATLNKLNSFSTNIDTNSWSWECLSSLRLNGWNWTEIS